METKIIVDMLTVDSVSILKRKFITEDETGEQLQVGPDWRRAYVNSEEGRKQLIAEVPEPCLSAVLAMWGDWPTFNRG